VRLWAEWAVVASKQHRDDEAIRRLAVALSVDDAYLATHRYLGEVYLRSQQWDALRDSQLRAIALERRLPWAWHNLAIAYASLGDLPQAIRASEALLRLTPEDYSALRIAAILQSRGGNSVVALYYARRAFARAPAADQPMWLALIEELRHRRPGPWVRR
jgi:tetratricopeptide (TPR) repeat protein